MYSYYKLYHYYFFNILLFKQLYTNVIKEQSNEPMYNEKILLFAIIFILTAMIALRACRCEPHIFRFKREFINELKNRFCFVHEVIENRFITLIDKADATIHIIDRTEHSCFPKSNPDDFREIFDKILFKRLHCELLFKMIYPNKIRYIISWDYVIYEIKIHLSTTKSDSLIIKIIKLDSIPVTQHEKEIKPSPA